MEFQMAQKILIVDDDVTLREMYLERLKTEGYIVESASNGDEGLRKAKSLVPDLILLDIMMPEKNGFDVLKEIKNEASLISVPILMLTALIQDENKKKVMELGADGYIVKSETMPAEIIDQVKITLKKHNSKENSKPKKD